MGKHGSPEFTDFSSWAQAGHAVFSFAEQDMHFPVLTVYGRGLCLLKAMKKRADDRWEQKRLPWWYDVRVFYNSRNDRARIVFGPCDAETVLPRVAESILRTKGDSKPVYLHGLFPDESVVLLSVLRVSALNEGDLPGVPSSARAVLSRKLTEPEAMEQLEQLLRRGPRVENGSYGASQFVPASASAATWRVSQDGPPDAEAHETNSPDAHDVPVPFAGLLSSTRNNALGFRHSAPAEHEEERSPSPSPVLGLPPQFLRRNGAYFDRDLYNPIDANAIAQLPLFQSSGATMTAAPHDGGRSFPFVDASPEQTYSFSL
ncbi:unnamed protein product [Amoebophrya sp. A25]|nr:unnamed protein product [Amoebophrya sp. A25]|eukprot:GSA25T00013561001.1